MVIEDLHSLFLNNIKEIYNSELLIAKSLPKMQEASNLPALKKAFSDHIRETLVQIQRLESIAKEFGISLEGQTSKGINGLLEDGEDIINADGNKDAKDAALIAAAQKIEHWEISAYGTIISMAELMGHTQAMRMLQDTLQEERNCDMLLVNLAEDEVNIRAKGASDN